MHKFTDNKGDDWAVAVTYGDVIRVEKECNGFKLIDMFSDDLAGLAKLTEDFGLTVAVAFSLCSEQAAKREVTPEGFASRMGGDTLDEAAKAIIEATIDFFPDAQRREALRGLVQRVWKTSEKMLATMAPASLARIDRQIELMTADQLDTWLTT